MAQVAETAVAYQARASHLTTRALSIVAALAVDAGLFWLIYVRANIDPPFADAEMFWVRMVAGFGAYAVLQQWTLANQTGRGRGFLARIDKFTAISPLIVVVVIQGYWIGVGAWTELSWRHHAAALLWSAFALIDFYATATTNARLRAYPLEMPAD